MSKYQEPNDNKLHKNRKASNRSHLTQSTSKSIESSNTTKPSIPFLTSEEIERKADMLINRMKKNRKHRRKWAEREGISCYRLYDRDIPEVPIVIDQYESYLHASILQSAHIHTEQLQEVGDAWLKRVATWLSIDFTDCFLKVRQRQKGKEQYKVHDRQGHRWQVNEAGLNFWINFTDYLDTGLFLDHRQTREMFAQEARGQRVLNLFAYTGSFTVYAAAAHAKLTYTIDSTVRYLRWAQDNLQLNHLDGDQHYFIRSDVRQFLQQARINQQKFDLVILDPPTFSNSKEHDFPFDLRRHHAQLFRDLYHIMPTGAVLYFSNNAKRFRLDEDIIRQWKVEEITQKTISLDFKQQASHRCWRCVRR
jgi:23S rRNA G2069 N7-methylase RlmK/C1962 C5-methylase RlmI